MLDLGPDAAPSPCTLVLKCFRVVDVHLNIMQVRAVDPTWGRDGDEAVAEVDEGIDEVPV